MAQRATGRPDENSWPIRNRYVASRRLDDGVFRWWAQAGAIAHLTRLLLPGNWPGVAVLGLQSHRQPSRPGLPPASTVNPEAVMSRPARADRWAGSSPRRSHAARLDSA
jgi:hypothetical protein